MIGLVNIFNFCVYEGDCPFKRKKKIRSSMGKLVVYVCKFKGTCNQKLTMSIWEVATVYDYNLKKLRELKFNPFFG